MTLASLSDIRLMTRWMTSAFSITTYFCCWIRPTHSFSQRSRRIRFKHPQATIKLTNDMKQRHAKLFKFFLRRTSATSSCMACHVCNIASLMISKDNNRSFAFPYHSHFRLIIFRLEPNTKNDNNN